MAGYAGRITVHIHGPDFTGLEQAEHKLVARGGIHQAHRLGLILLALGVGVKRRNFRHGIQGLTVENVHAAGLVIGYRHVTAVLRNSPPADAVTGLDHPVSHRAGEQVDFGEPAITTKDITVSGIPRVHH